MKKTLGLALLGSLCLPPPGGADDLWDGFREPPAEARPFVRWWWNGNRVTEAEAPRLRFLRLTPVDARQADQSRGRDGHGASHVRLNGHDLGARWWGHRRYPAAGLLRRGRNMLEVTVPTVLINYTRSLEVEENPMAQAWSHQREGAEPVGMLGPVRLHAVRVDTAASLDEGSSR